MVDVITPTTEKFLSGSTPACIVTFAGFDAAAEYGKIDMWSLGLGWIPKACTLIVNTTSGVTAAIDVDVDVSMDDTTYVGTNINNVTAETTYAYHPNPDLGEPDTTQFTFWRWWKVTFVDEGTGNTNTAKLFFTGQLHSIFLGE